MTVHRSATGSVIHEGDWLSIDGSTGEVIEGRIATKPSEVLQVLLDKLARPDAERGLPALRDADGVGRQGAPLKVRANADQPDQAGTRSRSGPRASACAAPSTCSSAASASRRCAR